MRHWEHYLLVFGKKMLIDVFVHFFTFSVRVQYKNLKQTALRATHRDTRGEFWWLLWRF